jgi:hypothetical protein
LRCRERFKEVLIRSRIIYVLVVSSSAQAAIAQENSLWTGNIWANRPIAFADNGRLVTASDDEDVVFQKAEIFYRWQTGPDQVFQPRIGFQITCVDEANGKRFLPEIIPEIETDWQRRPRLLAHVPGCGQLDLGMAHWSIGAFHTQNDLSEEFLECLKSGERLTISAMDSESVLSFTLNGAREAIDAMTCWGRE